MNKSPDAFGKRLILRGAAGTFKGVRARVRIQPNSALSKARHLAKETLSTPDLKIPPLRKYRNLEGKFLQKERQGIHLNSVEDLLRRAVN